MKNSWVIRLSGLTDVDQNIRHNFIADFAKSGYTASLITMALGVFYFFYGFNQSDHNFLLRFFSLLILLTSAARHYYGKIALEQGGSGLNKKQSEQLIITLFINSTAFIAISSIIAYRIGFNTLDIVGPILFTFVFIIGAPVTLGHCKPNLVYFVGGNMVAMLACLNLQVYSGEHNGDQLSSMYYWQLTIFFIASAFYAIKQGFIFRKQLIIRLKTEFDLIETNLELLNSRKKIIDQTLMTEQANRMSALGEMAGGVAHEINNPLAIIHANLQMALIKSSTLTPEITQRLTKAQNAVERITKIVRGLQSLCSSRKNLDDDITANIKDITLDIESISGERLKTNDIEFRNEIESNTYLAANPVQVSQILINLINNAVDALKETQLSLKYITVSSVTDQNHFKIIVANPGPEIPLEIQNKIFEPFFTTKQTNKGTGLGLSISKGLAKQNNATTKIKMKINFVCLLKDKY
jgi:signal transduction histidine kinase